MIRLLVTGGRHYDDDATVNAVLDTVARKHEIEVLIEGECPQGGADHLARLWAEAHKIPVAPYWIEHHRDGPWPRAGRNRNVRMFNESHPTHAVAFPGGPGTKHMIEVLQAHNVPVWIIKPRSGVSAPSRRISAPARSPASLNEPYPVLPSRSSWAKPRDLNQAKAKAGNAPQ